MYYIADDMGRRFHQAIVVSCTEKEAVIYQSNAAGKVAQVSYGAISYDVMATPKKGQYYWPYVELYRAKNYDEIADRFECDHSYNSVGVCTKCRADFPLTVTKLNTTATVIGLNSSSKTAPAHTAPYGDAPITKRYTMLQTIQVTGSAKNAYGNLWYQIAANGETYWIVSDYVMLAFDLFPMPTPVNTATGYIVNTNSLNINDKPGVSPQYSTAIGLIPRA